MFALGVTGTARASSTAINASPGEASITDPSPAMMSFPLKRSGDLGYDTWLHYQTEEGTAKAGTDYGAVSGDIRVPAGSSEKAIAVQVLGKAAFTPDKQFTLKLLDPAGVGPTPSFTERVIFEAGGSPTDRAKTADVNSDGRPDLIVPNSKTVSVLLNTTAPGAASPSLAAAQSFEVGMNPNVVPSDVNGDGHPDLVVANAADDDFSVLLNTTAPGASTPSFASQQVFEAGRGPRWPVLEDLNGDGRPDLIIVNDQFDEQAISVFFNTTPPGASTASFQPRQFFEFSVPGRVGASDLNGDGRPDLILSAQGGIDEVFVILNATPPGASNLSLGGESSYSVGETPNEISVADLNGDNRPDLAVSNLASNSASVLLNGTPPGASLPSFAPQQSFAVGNNPRSIQAVDLNGDGRVDLITGNHANHSLSVLLNTTAPGASALRFVAQTLEAEPIPLGLVTTDLNGDGRQDLIYTRESNKLLVSLNTTPAPTAVAPSLAAKQDAAAGGGPSSVGASDLNGDGKPDLVVANRYDDTASVLLDTTAPGALTPSFTAQQTFALGDSPSALASADFNLDGKSDVVVADEGANAASVLFNTTVPGAGTASFAVQQEFGTGEAPAGVATADFNGDGRPDLVVANHGENDVSVLFDTTVPGAPTPSFSSQQTFVAGNGPSAVAVADVNDDSKPDVVVANHDEDTASVLLNTTTPGAPTPSFSAQQAFATDEQPSSVKASDLNGDGRPDLVVGNEGSDSTSILFNTTTPGAATSSFAPPQSFEAGDAPSSIATTDLNSDGIPDLLVANGAGDTTSILLNTTDPGASTPSFAAQQTFATGGDPTSISTADLNGDGGLDVITADGGSDEISALLDTQYTASISPASVIGTIHYAIPQVTLTPSSLAFDAQTLGAGATKIETLSNTGGTDLVIKGIAISGANATQFSQASSCPATLEAGSSCSISITFAPDAAAAASAALTVTSNSPSSPDTTMLSGTGRSVTPPPLAPSRLRIEGARAKTVRPGVRITVHGTIAGGAQGVVRVRARIRHQGHWVSVARWVQIAARNWGTRLSFTAADRRSPIYLSARFDGSPGFRYGYAKRRLRLR